jgi:hypothetical protein
LVSASCGFFPFVVRSVSVKENRGVAICLPTSYKNGKNKGNTYPSKGMGKGNGKGK